MREWFEECSILRFNDKQWCGYFFAEISAIAYHDGKKVGTAVKKLGFKSYKFLDTDGAQAHIFSNAEHMVIAFRGTEPKQFSDVKADLLAIKRKSRTEGRVHMGFKMELRKLWPDIEALIHKKKQKIWITGHSLGGGMATLCASRIEERDPILYTYGSPRVGGGEFVKGCDIVHNRYKNNNDIVPSVPLWLMGYKHHGELQYLNFHGKIRKLTLWQRVKDSLRGRRAALKKWQLFDGLHDHSITDYSDKLKAIWIENKPSLDN